MSTKYSRIICFLLLYFSSFKCISQIWPILSTDDTHYDRISAVFGEIHDTGIDHYHEGIDIDDYSNNTTIRPIEDGIVVSRTANTIVIGHGLVNFDGTYPKRTVIHEFISNPSLVQGASVTAGVSNLGHTSTPWGHLHLEMWYRDGNIDYPVNPLSNDVNWELPIIGGDQMNPQINNIFIKKISNQPNGFGSGYVYNTSSAVSDFVVGTEHFLKIHFMNLDYTTLNSFNSLTDKIYLWGNFSFVVNCRDRGINPNYIGASGSGNGLTIKKLRWLIDNNSNPKYHIIFDRLKDAEVQLLDRIFYTQFNSTVGSSPYFGNDDYIKLYDLNTTHIYPIQPINNTLSNGVWFTKASATTDELFNVTPSSTARVNDEAKYKEGTHEMTFSAIDAAGFNGNCSLSVVVDNFRPYVKKVEVIANGIGSSRTVYRSEWQWNSGPGTLDLNPIDISNATHGYYVNPGNPVNEDVTIRVTFSEPMLYQTPPYSSPMLRISSGGFSFPISNNPMIEGTLDNADNTEFIWTISHNDLINAPLGFVNISIKALDYSGNSLMGLTRSSTNIASNIIPVHQASGSWLPAWNNETDFVHGFTIMQCGNGHRHSSGNNGTTSSGCLDADFNTTTGNTTVNVGDLISFEDQSVGLPTSWSWDFGDYIHYSTDQYPNAFSYSNPGVYTVKLTINDGTETDLEEKVNYITVNSNGSGSNVTASFSTVQASQSIYEGDYLTFVPNVQNANGNVTYHWNFPYGSPSSSTVQNPQVTYPNDGNYNVSLYVSDMGGNTSPTHVETNYVSVAELPGSGLLTVSISGSGNAYTNSTTLFTASTINGTFPYSYSWDFGDGPPVTGGPMASHTYTTSGLKIVTVTVTDNNANTATSTLAVNVVNASGLTSDFTISNNLGTYHPENVGFTPTSGSTCSVNFHYYWDFGDNNNNTTTSNGNYTVFHNYIVAGSYTVTMHVYDYCGGDMVVQKTVTIGTQIHPLENVGFLFSNCNSTLPFVTSDGVIGGTTIPANQLISPNDCPWPGQVQEYYYNWEVNGNYAGVSHSNMIATYIDAMAICGSLPCTFLLGLTVKDYGQPQLSTHVEQYVTVYPDLEVVPISPTNTLSICPGGSTTYTPEVIGGTGDGTYSYNWIWPSTADLSASCTDCQSPVITLNDPSPGHNGPFEVTLVVSDNRSLSSLCPDVYYIFDVEGILVNIDLGADLNACLNSTKEIEGIVTGGTGDYTVQWSPSLGINCTNCSDASQEFHLNSTGTYAYTATVHDASGCSSSDEINLIVSNDHPNILLNDISVCPNKLVTFVPNVSGGSGLYTGYEWTLAANHDVLSSSQTCSFNSYYSAGLNLVVRDANGCSSAKSVYYLVDQTYPLEANPGPSTQYACYPDGKTLHSTVSGGAGSYTYEWTNSGGIVISNSKDYSAPPPGNQSPSIYTLSVSDQNGCWAQSSVELVEDRITSNPELRALCSSEPLSQFIFNCNTSGGIGVKQYDWTINSVPSTFFSNPYSQNGTLTNNYSGFYYCKVSDDFCNFKLKGTVIASLTIIPSNPVHLREEHLCYGAMANFIFDSPYIFEPFVLGNSPNNYLISTPPENFNDWGFDDPSVTNAGLFFPTNLFSAPGGTTSCCPPEAHHTCAAIGTYNLYALYQTVCGPVYYYFDITIDNNQPAVAYDDIKGPYPIVASNVYITGQGGSMQDVGTSYTYTAVDMDLPAQNSGYECTLNNDGTEIIVIGEDIRLNENFWAKEGSSFEAVLSCLDPVSPRFVNPNNGIDSLHAENSPILNVNHTVAQVIKAYPNPTIGSFVLEIALSENMQCELSIESVIGNRVVILSNEYITKKNYNVDMFSLGLIQGIYNVRLATKDKIYNQKLVFIQ